MGLEVCGQKKGCMGRQSDMIRSNGVGWGGVGRERRNLRERENALVQWTFNSPNQ